MTHRRFLTISCSALVLLASVAADPPAVSGGPGLRAGAARVVITPPRETPMAGYYSTRFATGVHDDLHSSALVFEREGAFAAIVCLDLIGTTRALVEEARAEVTRLTGIPGSGVMISATHSHTGPMLADSGSRYEIFGGEAPAAKAWRAALPGLIARSVAEATSKLKPARVFHAVGHCPGLAFNRRFHMTDGTVGWNPGKLNPKIIRPAGPVDEEVPVVLVESASGEPIACHVSFAMHLDTVGGREISADYPYQLGRCLKAALGEQLVPLFAMGTSGDVNHINVSSAAPQQGHGEAARIGTLLAASALRALERRSAAAPGPLRASAESVTLEPAPFDPEALRTAKGTAELLRGDSKSPPPFLEQVRALRVLDVADRAGKPFAGEVQCVTLGPDVAFVALPGEIFVELGLAIRRGSAFRTTSLTTLANGSIGYVPTARAWPEGNYEVISARVARGSGEKLVESALAQLRAAR
jgi:hypothetical protein